MKGSYRDFNVIVTFRHDVYRHLFNDKTTLFSNDFSNCCKYFKEGWDQCYKDYNSAVNATTGLSYYIQYGVGYILNG